MSKRQIEFFIFDIYIAILKIKKVSSEFDNAENLQYDFKSWNVFKTELDFCGVTNN